MKKVMMLLLVLLSSPVHAQNSNIHYDTGVYKPIIVQWTNSISKSSNISSTSYIVKKSGGKDKLHKAGHRHLIVWIPEATDLHKPITLVLWFHGHWGYVPHRTFEDRTINQLASLSNKNFVLALPEMPWSIHTTTPTKRNSQLWMRPGDFMKFVSQVENILLNHQTHRVGNVTETGKRLGKIDYRIVGHSAGGSTIKRLGITGDLCKLNPSMIVWSDSSYGHWLDNSWDGCLKNNTNTVIKIFVRKWGPPWENAVRFMSEFQEAPSNVELHVMSKPWTHKSIGNNIVKLSGVLE